MLIFLNSDIVKELGLPADDLVESQLEDQEQMESRSGEESRSDTKVSEGDNDDGNDEIEKA